MNVVIVTIQNANEIFVQFSWQINFKSPKITLTTSPRFTYFFFMLNYFMLLQQFVS